MEVILDTTEVTLEGLYRRLKKLSERGYGTWITAPFQPGEALEDGLERLFLDRRSICFVRIPHDKGAMDVLAHLSEEGHDQLPDTIDTMLLAARDPDLQMPDEFHPILADPDEAGRILMGPGLELPHQLPQSRANGGNGALAGPPGDTVRVDPAPMPTDRVAVDEAPPQPHPMGIGAEQRGGTPAPATSSASDTRKGYENLEETPYVLSDEPYRTYQDQFNSGPLGALSEQAARRSRLVARAIAGLALLVLLAAVSVWWTDQQQQEAMERRLAASDDAGAGSAADTDDPSKEPGTRDGGSENDPDAAQGESGTAGETASQPAGAPEERGVPASDMRVVDNTAAPAASPAASAEETANGRDPAATSAARPTSRRDLTATPPVTDETDPVQAAAAPRLAEATTPDAARQPDLAPQSQDTGAPDSGTQNTVAQNTVVQDTVNSAGAPRGQSAQEATPARADPDLDRAAPPTRTAAADPADAEFGDGQEAGAGDDTDLADAGRPLDLREAARANAPPQTPIRTAALTTGRRQRAGSYMATRAMGVHACPAADCVRVAGLAPGERLRVTEPFTDNGWASVQLAAGGRSGFVPGAFLERPGQASARAPSPAAAVTQDCSSCPPLVLVGLPDRSSVLVSKAPISRADWWSCVRDAICPAKGAAPQSASERASPVEGLTARDASAYATWLSGKAGRRYRVAPSDTIRAAISGSTGATGGLSGMRVVRDL